MMDVHCSHTTALPLDLPAPSHCVGVNPFTAVSASTAPYHLLKPLAHKREGEVYSWGSVKVWKWLEAPPLHTTFHRPRLTC